MKLDSCFLAGKEGLFRVTSDYQSLNSTLPIEEEEAKVWGHGIVE